MPVSTAMRTTLLPAALGMKELPLRDAIDLAARAGFDSVHIDLADVERAAAQHGNSAVAAWFRDAKVDPISFNLPVWWRDEERYPEQIARLPARADLAASLGCLRAGTFVMPASNEHTRDRHYALALERLRAIGEALEPTGIRVGLEFCGPSSFRAQFAHPFIWTMKDVLQLARDAGTGNIGLLLDAWHIYTGGGDVADFGDLRPEEAVIVHINDAPLGLAMDELQDLSRAMPQETGRIDLAGFMRALGRLGYDGPVMAEPFSRRVEALTADDPLAAAVELREATVAAIGLA
jgi:sugar phosphate isomerase/epimerase